MIVVRTIWVTVLSILTASCALDRQMQKSEYLSSVDLEYQKSPDSEWKSKPAISVEQFLGRKWSNFKTPKVSEYGGLLAKQFEATGFFYTKRIGYRWWLIGPDGHPLIRMSLNAVYRRTRSKDIEVLSPDLQTRMKADHGRLWATETVTMLRDLGCNGLGRWSEYGVFNETEARFPYTTSLKFMASFGEELGVSYEKYGHMGYREDCIPVFHPDFPSFCDQYARKEVANLANDPYLLGHYTDNEIPANKGLLDKTLALDPEDPLLGCNQQEAWKWYRQRRGRDASTEDISDEDRKAYLGYVYERYYAITSAAIRKHDPNHLVLGSRLHGAALKIEPVLLAAGKHLDVVSFNTYHFWELSPKLMNIWEQNTGRPFIISEFCIKGEFSGLPNSRGAGWIVRTQSDRGIWYQNFVIRMLQSPNCVGWDYFKYRDDIDVNKGVLTIDFRPYPDFYNAMKQVHQATYLIIEQIDAGRNP